MAKPYSTTLVLVSNILLLFNKYTSFTYILLFYYTIYFTSSIPFTPTDDKQYLPSDDPNITNLMVSHYDCAKQYNLRQSNVLNVKQCTEAPSNIQHANVQARVYVRAKANVFALSNVKLMLKKYAKFAFRAMSNTNVLIELFGIITLCHYLSLLTLLNVKTLLDILMELTTKY